MHMHVHGRTRRTRVGASQWNRRRRSTSRTKLTWPGSRTYDEVTGASASFVVPIVGKKSRAIASALERNEASSSRPRKKKKEATLNKIRDVRNDALRII